MSVYNVQYPDGVNDFEKEIEDFKQSLLNAVRAEYKAKLDSLLKENVELQDVKVRMQEIEAERAKEKREVEEVKANALMEAKKLRLAELMKDVQTKVYRSKAINSQSDKCDKCNDNRQIEYTTPLGRVAYEDCTCKSIKKKFVVEPAALCRIEHYDATFGIKTKYYDLVRDTAVNVSTMYDKSQGFGKVTDWTYFAKEDDCQEYCDWLNEKESGGEGDEQAKQVQSMG